LWALGEKVSHIQPGQYLGQRYLCKAPRIFLDTQPGLPPESVDELPDAAIPYIKLNAYKAHVPQAYGWALPEDEAGSIQPVLLLEQGAIATPVKAPLLSGKGTTLGEQTALLSPLPLMTEQWADASAMRQLNWLWQMAKLWQPLASEQVVSTLLNPSLIRVEDSLIRLLELNYDQRQTANVGASLFHQLGTVWQQWISAAQPELQPFLKGLCQHLIDGDIQHPGQVVACLDRALFAAGKVQERHIQFASQTDKGPTRPRNEDACYPPKPGTVYLNSKKNKTTAAQLESSLVMVCDGIGGHLGGAVASGLAIEKVYHHLHDLPLGQMRPLAFITELRKAVCAANDLISERNDQEERRDRERMGTTLVMGVIQNHELYVTHLGDSRAYLITREGCYQITLDDDVASREARLGYGLYRSALTHPGSGSLVQALGMASSGSLHPTVQRLILDGEGLLLLCSDGLSDNDLVDDLWQSHLLPLLHDKNGAQCDLAQVVRTLIHEANQQNGHDNVSVSLIHWSAYHSTPFKLDERLSDPPKLTSSIPGLVAKNHLNSAMPAVPSTQIGGASPTRIVTPSEPHMVSPSSQRESTMSSRSLASLLVGILFLLGLGGVLAYVLLPSVSNRVDTWLGFEPSTPSRPSLEADSESDATESESIEGANIGLKPLQIGTFVQIVRADRGDRPAPDGLPLTPALYPEPSYETVSTAVNPSLPEASPSSSGVAQLADSVANERSGERTSTMMSVPDPIPVSTGAVLKILRQQEDDNQRRWVQLRVCYVALHSNAAGVPAERLSASPEASVSDENAASDNTQQGSVLQVGHMGWMTEGELRLVSELNPSVDPSTIETCNSSPSS
jgi:protein phosphatase